MLFALPCIPASVPGWNTRENLQNQTVSDNSCKLLAIKYILQIEFFYGMSISKISNEIKYQI